MVNAMGHSLTLPKRFVLGLPKLQINSCSLTSPGRFQPCPASLNPVHLAMFASITIMLDWFRFRQAVTVTAPDDYSPLFVQMNRLWLEPIHRVLAQVWLATACLRLGLTKFIRFLSTPETNEPFGFGVLAALHQGSENKFQLILLCGRSK